MGMGNSELSNEELQTIYLKISKIGDSSIKKAFGIGERYFDIKKR